MKNKVIYGILLSAIFGINLSFAANANTFEVEIFKSTANINSLEDADALIRGENLDSTASGSYEFIDFKDVAYGSWGHSDIDNLFPGTPGYPNINNFAVRVTAKITITSAGKWTFLTTADDGVRLRINGSNVILKNRLQADNDNLGTVYLPVGSHDLELVLFENNGEATLELWAAPGTQKNYNSNFKLVRDTVNGGTAATNSALARRKTENPGTENQERVSSNLSLARRKTENPGTENQERVNSNLPLARRNIENQEKANTTIFSKSSHNTDIVLALVLGIVLGMILMLFSTIIIFLIFLGWHKFYKKQYNVVSNGEIVKMNSILKPNNVED